MTSQASIFTEEENAHKKHLGIVIVGHVDSGKSTTTGRLLFELGGLNARQLEKLQAEADRLNKSSFSFAFFMDKQKDERERGVTISCTTKEFFTQTKHYTIIDAPGHKDFIKNMISGASQADVALLMVPANKGGFETAIQKGDHKEGVIQGQTRQHAKLLYLLGIEQVMVGVNKMDDPSVNYSEDRYNEIKEEMTKMLKGFGFKPKQIPFIPMSGWTGENLSKHSDKMPWYKGWEANLGPKKTVKGTTLIDALETFVQVPNRPTDVPLRMPVSGVYKIKGTGDVITGRIEQGILEPKSIVGFTPTGVKGNIFSIEMHHKSVPQALPGDNVGLNVKGLVKDNMPRVGDVLYIEKEGECKPVKSFVAQVAVQDHPGELKPSSDGNKGGFTPVVHVRTSKAPCMLSKINWKIGKKTGGTKLESPKFIEQGEQGEVEFKPKMPLYLESFENSKGLGRIAVMDSNTLIMLGKVISVEY